MKTILLLRHAKWGWGDPGLSDHDRPLNRRGERAARAMAEYLVKQGPLPDQILCSTATRARQTLAPLVELLASVPPISLEKGLYLAPEDALLARMRDLPPEVGTALLVGHNDGIGEFAAGLAGRGKATTLAEFKGPIREIEVYPGHSAEWWLVPVAAGRATDLRCDIKSADGKTHADQGMVGEIVIE